MATADNKTIYARLLAAQKEFSAASKNAENPFFKSSYATLNEVWESCKEPLHKQGLFVSQQLQVTEDGQQVLLTRIYDETGDSINSTIKVIAKSENDPQALGSGITYARRYALSAILGLMTEEDDDGNRASSKKSENQEPGITLKQQNMIVGLAKEKNITSKMKGLTEKLYGKDTFMKLSISEASDFIGKLQTMGAKTQTDSSEGDDFEDYLALSQEPLV